MTSEAQGSTPKALTLSGADQLRLDMPQDPSSFLELGDDGSEGVDLGRPTEQQGLALGGLIDVATKPRAFGDDNFFRLDEPRILHDVSNSDHNFGAQKNLRLIGNAKRIAHLISRLEGVSHGESAMSTEQMVPFFSGNKSVTRCMFPVACVDTTKDEIAGYAFAQTIPNPDGESPLEWLLPDGDVYVQGMGTVPRYRGNGIATGLIDRCRAFAYCPPGKDKLGQDKPLGSTWLTTHPTNWSMARAASEVGANGSDERCRMIGIAGWETYFDRRPSPHDGPHPDEGYRIVFKYDPGMPFLGKWAEISPDSCIDLEDVAGAIQSSQDKIALYAENVLKNTTRRPIDRSYNVGFAEATAQLLDSGYIILQTSASSAPIPRRRLFVRINSLPDETARRLHEARAEIEKLKQRSQQLRLEKTKNA